MKIATLTIAAALACGAIDVQAATQPDSASAVQAGVGQVEPNAVDALNRMSGYLRSIPAFQITLQTQRDDVDDYGQLITLNGRATYRVRRPDSFSIDLALPNSTGQYVYDGKTVTVYDPKTGFYAKVAAAPTIRQTLDLAEAKYGLTVPLDDLFHWDQGDDYSKKLTSAHFVGKAKVAGQDADQYAFRQLGVDWQIWIAAGAKPLPLRVMIVASQDPARPRFQADLAWDTDPKFTAETFVFTPPPGAKPIPIASNP
jgi:hypothetical protein